MRKIYYGQEGLTTDPLKTKRVQEFKSDPLGRMESNKLKKQIPTTATTTSNITKPLGYDDYLSNVYSGGSKPTDTSIGSKIGTGIDFNSPLATGISVATDAISPLFDSVSLSPQGQTVRDIEGGVAKALGNAIGGPIVGSAASMFVKTQGAIKNATGLTSEWVSNSDYDDVRDITGKNTNFGNKALNTFTNIIGNSALINPLYSALLTKKTDNLYTTQQFNNTSGFANSLADANLLNKYTGKRTGIWTANDINAAVNQIQPDVNSITGLVNRNNLLLDASGNTAQYLNANYNRKISEAKQGTKLLSKEELANILSKRNQETPQVEAFQNGGVIGIETSILPEGALHRELNHLEDTNPEIGEEVTTKGIPVVVTDKDGNIEQVAEIEKEEIVFRKSFTEQLEELWKDGSEEAMIEAGKLLVEEIITNTQDNTGQLEK